jgi:hypothetical protein
MLKTAAVPAPAAAVAIAGPVVTATAIVAAVIAAHVARLNHIKKNEAKISPRSFLSMFRSIPKPPG